MAALVAVVAQQLPGVRLVVLAVPGEDDRPVAPQHGKRQAPELDVGHALDARAARAEPLGERKRGLVVVLLAPGHDRPAERDAAVPPEVVPAVRDPVQVGVVGVVRAPGQVGPDDERRVRRRVIDGEGAVAEHDGGAKLVAGWITDDVVVEARGIPPRERTAHEAAGQAVIRKRDGRMAAVCRDEQRGARARLEAVRRVDVGGQPLDPHDLRLRETPGVAPRRPRDGVLGRPRPLLGPWDDRGEPPTSILGNRPLPRSFRRPARTGST